MQVQKESERIWSVMSKQEKQDYVEWWAEDTLGRAFPLWSMGDVKAQVETA